MTTPPHKNGKPPQKPAEIVGEALEKATDTLSAILKHAALKRSDRAHEQVAHAAEPAKSTVATGAGKPGLQISPLAVDFPKIPPIGGVEIAIGRAGFYKHDRPDLLIMKFAEGTTCAGVFTRHRVGSAPVDWCKRQLEASEGEDVRALVVNAGCANSFTGKLGADAARRVAGAVAKRLDCRQRDVMQASTGVIGVLLDDAKIVAKLPELEGKLHADGWAEAGRAIMTTDTFPKGSYAEAEIDGVEVSPSTVTQLNVSRV